MIIFKDLITGDEMFTDSSKYKVIDECLFEVECRLVSRKHGDVHIDGANPSQEEGDEGTEEVVESGLDLVLNQRLIETGFTKSDFKSYLKTYTKTLQEKWKEVGMDDSAVAEAKTKFTEAVKKVLPKIGDLQFFMGESSNPDGLIAFLEYRDNGAGGETPIMIFFKHGLEEEKV